MIAHKGDYFHDVPPTFGFGCCKKDGPSKITGVGTGEKKDVSVLDLFLL
jgi:hypothetical protein